MLKIEKIPVSNATLYFTANECYGEDKDVDAMMIKRNNRIVKKNDVVVHCGNFSKLGNRAYLSYHVIRQLTGRHIFLTGDDDRWQPVKDRRDMYTIRHKHQVYVASYYPFLTWPLKEQGSWNVYGIDYHEPWRVRQFNPSVYDHEFTPVNAKRIQSECGPNSALLKAEAKRNVPLNLEV